MTSFPASQVLSRARSSTARGLAVLALAGVLTGGCSQIGVDPEEPAAIEFAPLTVSAIVIGDTLRNSDGVVTPVTAIVRNIRGEVITDIPVTYLYADATRDSALVVDATTGVVRAVDQPTGTARIAARAGAVLQVVRTIAVTTRPDSMDRNGQPAIVALTTTLPDTSRLTAEANTSRALAVVVRHVESATSVSTVPNWLVRFRLVQPANADNDTTASVFLVNDNGRASTVDTTDNQGVASRRVRVRAAQFPQGTAPDSVVVEATASYRGAPLKGAPIRMVLPVVRGTGAPAIR